MATSNVTVVRALRAASVLLFCAAALAVGSVLLPERSDEHEEEEGGPESYGELMRANEEFLNAWGQPPPGALDAAIKAKQAMVEANVAASVPNAEGEWHEFGIGPLITEDPRYGSVNGLGIGFNSGRIDSLDYDPVNQRLFASVGTGGVWMSTDGARNWQNIGDTLPSLVIGQVAWTPAGGGTVLAGGGEPLNGGFTFVGNGAYWSSDLGATWTKATGVPDGIMTYQIEVDPGHPEIVYTATSKGLYRSTDAGRSYTYIPLDTGCSDLADPKCLLANFVTDVVVKEPGGIASKAVTCGATGCPVLAVVGFYGAKRKYIDGVPQAPGNGLFRSNTGEPGTWAELTSAYGDGISPLGFATQERIGRTEFGNATGPNQDHNYLYAIVQDAVRLNSGVGAVDVPDPGLTGAPTNTYFNGIYVSPDFGSSWIRMADEAELAKPSTGSSLTTTTAVASNFAPGIQAWYNLYVRVDPTRADANGVPTRLVFGLEEVWTNRAPVALNGVNQQTEEDFKVIGTYFAGESCQFLSGVPVCPTNDPGTVSTTHPDQHDAIFLPITAGGVDLIVANDGGAYTQRVAAGEEFTNAKWNKGSNEGFYTLLPYGIGVAKDCTVWFGLQDNGSGRIQPDNRAIYETYGGDGTFAATDPANSDVAYTATPGAALRRTTDGGRTWTTISPTLANALFVKPFVLDPTDPKYLVTGGNQIVGNVNAPASGTWTTMFTLGNGPGNAPRSMTAVDTHGANTYVGFCGFCGVRSRTVADQVFARGIATNVGGAQPPAKGSANGWHFAAAAGLPNRYVTALEIDPAVPTTVYATLGGYSNAQWQPPGMYTDQNANIGTGHVFKSTNAGESFVDISGNLPDVPVFWVVERAGQLIVGTQIGPFISSDTNGSLWAPMGAGMPNVPVLQLNTWLGDLTNIYAATFGRGVWRYIFPGERDVCPVPTPDLGAVAPVLGAPTGVDSAGTDPACSTETDGDYTLNFAYTAPEGGANPAAFRVEEASRIEEKFFDSADQQLSGGQNSLWVATGFWTSQVNPTTGSMAYYVPDLVEQNDTLTLKQPLALPAGGAVLSFTTTQSTEADFDYGYAEISDDDGASWATLALWSGNYIGDRQFDISSYAGKSVKLRFRFTSDSNTGLAGWFVEDIRILSDDFAPIADVGATATSHALADHVNGVWHYRVRALFDTPAGTVGGPYSNYKCVDVDVPNLPPLANAGADFSVDEGASAMLSAAGSSDPDNGPLTYAWAQTAGPAVVLAGADTAAPSFTAPAVNADTALTFQLTVTDVGGASATDTITVTVIDLNLPPVAVAGDDFSLESGASALLSGAGSSDPDGDVLSYRWTQTGGPDVGLLDPDSATPSFTAPQVTAATPLTFRLTVSDASNVEASDDVVVTVRPPASPEIGNNRAGAVPAASLLLLGLALLARRLPRRYSPTAARSG